MFPNILSLAIICLLLVPQLSASLNVSDPAVADSASGLKKFNSTEELKEYLQKNTLTARNIEYEYLPSPIPAPAINFGSSPLSEASDKASITGSLSGLTLPADYSTTNVQVAGVDEADFVKNDGKYIYIIADNRLVIVDAYPASKAKVVSQTRFDGTPCNLFLSGNYIVVFTTEYGYKPMPVKGGVLDGIIEPIEKTIMPPYRDGPVTHALVYSLSDKARPRLEKDLLRRGELLQLPDDRRLRVPGHQGAGLLLQ